MTQSKNIKGNKKFLVSIRRDIQEVHIVYAKDKHEDERALYLNCLEDMAKCAEESLSLHLEGVAGQCVHQSLQGHK
jgi:hypothetical protein